MSFDDVFHDYIRDIPMDMSRKFFPTQNIRVDMIHIPDTLTFPGMEYSFEAESRAREQFDKQNEPITLDSTTKTITLTTTTTSSGAQGTSSECLKTSESTRSGGGGGVGGYDVLSQNVLVPCPVNSAPSMLRTSPSSSTTKTQKASTPNAAVTSMSHSLQEFESTANVFDDVEILALDDKKALEEVMMLTNSWSISSSAPPPPSAHQSITNHNNNNNRKSMTSSVSPEIPAEKIGRSQQEELRKRLLTKGYRTDLVEKTLGMLPKNRLVHIEYYMKACRTIEKTGRSTVDETLPFLIQCDLSDKMMILAYSDVCASLLKMGFQTDQTFEAVAVERGDQERALTRLLPA